MRRATLLALAVLAGCGAGDAHWEAALPAESDSGGVRQVAEVRVGQSDALVERARLERMLSELEQWESERGRPLPARLARWQTFAAAASDSGYAPIAQARLAAIGRAVAEQQRKAIGAATRSCLDLDWDKGLDLLRASISRYPGHASTEEARKRLIRLVAHRRDHAGAWRARVGGGGKDSWVPRSGPARLQGARAVGPRSKKWRTLVFNAPGQSFNRYKFRVPPHVKTATLILKHHVARAGTRYAPVSVVVNNKIVASRFNAAEAQSVEHGRTAWDISRALQPGDNTVTIRLEHDALTVYWLQQIELTSVSPAELMRVR